MTDDQTNQTKRTGSDIAGTIIALAVFALAVWGLLDIGVAVFGSVCR